MYSIDTLHLDFAILSQHRLEHPVGLVLVKGIEKLVVAGVIKPVAVVGLAAVVESVAVGAAAEKIASDAAVTEFVAVHIAVEDVGLVEEHLEIVALDLETEVGDTVGHQIVAVAVAALVIGLSLLEMAHPP